MSQDSWASQIGDHSCSGDSAPCSVVSPLGGGDWCVDGGDQRDSFRAGRFSRENAGLGGWEAKDNGKRETKVMTPGSWLAEISEEERGFTGVGSLPIEMQSES